MRRVKTRILVAFVVHVSGIGLRHVSSGVACHCVHPVPCFCALPTGMVDGRTPQVGIPVSLPQSQVAGGFALPLRLDLGVRTPLGSLWGSGGHLHWWWSRFMGAHMVTCKRGALMVTPLGNMRPGSTSRLQRLLHKLPVHRPCPKFTHERETRHTA